jgi:hypothetical protein
MKGTAKGSHLRGGSLGYGGPISESGFDGLCDRIIKACPIVGIPDISVWFSNTPALPRPVNPFLFRVAPPVH